MNRRRHVVVTAFTCGALMIPLAGAGRATDLTGAWASDREACPKIFVTKGNKTSFRRNSDVHGAGFIIEGRQIRGPAARCKITQMKVEKELVNLLASCATDIMYSNVQFTLKVVSDDEVNRLFPGLEALDLPFYRCSLSKE